MSEKNKIILENLCDNLIDSFSIMKKSNDDFVKNFFNNNITFNDEEKIVITKFLNKQKLLNWFYFVNSARSLRDWLISVNSFTNNLYKPNYKGFLSNQDERTRNEIIKFIEGDDVLSTIFYNLFIWKLGIKTKEEKNKFEKFIKFCDFYSLFLHWDKYSISINEIFNKNENILIRKIDRYKFDNNEYNNFFENTKTQFEKMIQNTSIDIFKKSIENLFNKIVTLCKLKKENIYYGLPEKLDWFLLSNTTKIISRKYVSIVSKFYKLIIKLFILKENVRNNNMNGIPLFEINEKELIKNCEQINYEILILNNNDYYSIYCSLINEFICITKISNKKQKFEKWISKNVDSIYKFIIFLLSNGAKGKIDENINFTK